MTMIGLALVVIVAQSPRVRKNRKLFGWKLYRWYRYFHFPLLSLVSDYKDKVDEEGAAVGRKSVEPGVCEETKKKVGSDLNKMDEVQK